MVALRHGISVAFPGFSIHKERISRAILPPPNNILRAFFLPILSCPPLICTIRTFLFQKNSHIQSIFQLHVYYDLDLLACSLNHVANSTLHQCHARKEIKSSLAKPSDVILDWPRLQHIHAGNSAGECRTNWVYPEDSKTEQPAVVQSST